MTLLISQAAHNDIATAVAWYEDQRSGLGIRFLDALNYLLESIENTPESFPPDETGPRQRNLRFGLPRRFPYKVVFEQLPNGRTIVLAVAHTSRHPDGWKSRLNHPDKDS